MTFTARSIDALKAYLRTAAVIDDKVTQTRESAPATPNTPGRIVQRSAESEAPRESSGAPLDSEALTAAFLNQGILCAVFDSTQVLTDKKKITALLRSDILVVDWKLDDDGTITTRFIHRCAAMHPHALHMICIYTSENDFGAIRRKLEDTDNTLRSIPELRYIPALREIPDTDDAYAFGSIYVLIVKKNVEEAKLPERLLDAFAPLVGGLLRNAVFHSIGAIRTNTHALLDRFHPDLDPAFVTHRVYSDPCEDTERHIIPLIGSEIGSILAQEKIPQHLNSEAIQCWLDSGSSQNEDSGIPQTIKDIINEKRADILAKGIMSVRQIRHDSGMDSVLKKSLLTAFWGAKDGVRSDVMLAMLMSCEHRYSSDEKPVLKSGTLLKLDEQGSVKYFLCIQPPCDCVRIEKSGRNFIFACVLPSSNTENFNFSYIDEYENILYFKKSSKVYSSSLIKFKPAPGKTCIFAKEISGKWFFEDIDGKQYERLFQLNELHALRTIQECSNTLSRIGLMESDWQRRIASKK